MKATRFICAGLLSVLLGFGQARGQTPNNPSPVPPESTNGQLSPDNDQPTVRTLSSWITNGNAPGQQCCQGTVGGSPPLGTELFFRAGPSVPVGGTLLGRVLDIGWMVELGGRTLFFDNSRDRAWTVELGVTNMSNRAGVNDYHIPLSIISLGTRQNFGQGTLPGVTVRGINRTYVNLGVGREYYLWGSANSPETNLRWGFDGGGRYGTAKADFYEIRHRTGVTEGGYAAIHSDLECPCSCGIIMLGLRAEWDYTHTQTLLQSDSNLQDLNFLVNFGIRY